MYENDTGTNVMIAVEVDISANTTDPNIENVLRSSVDSGV